MLAVDQMRAAVRDLGIPAVWPSGEPAQFAWPCRMRVQRVEPGRPVPDNPKPFGGRRRVRSDHDAAALRLVGRAIPSDDETILRGEEISALVEVDKIVRIALEALLVVLVFTARKRDHPVIKLPALQLAVIAGAVAEDFRNPLHQLQRILVDATQDQRAFVRRQCKSEPELGFAASGLAAVK